MSIITIELLSKIRDRYLLPWCGTHGISHWARVYENGIRLSEQEGVNKKVVQLFSVFHDSQRKNEHTDPSHGARGAQLASRLRGSLPLNSEEFDLLTVACRLHTSARTHENITVAACFDSDRLDLWRIGTTPDPNFLCTPMAKLPETIEWAMQKNTGKVRMMPENAFGIPGYNCGVA